MSHTLINLDVSKEQMINPLIFGRVADENYQVVDINIFENGEPFSLADCQVCFEGVTAADTKVIDSQNIIVKDAAKGQISYTFSNSAFSAAGNYKYAYFSIKKSTKRITTNQFEIFVLPVVDIDAKEAETFLSEYNKLIAELNEKYTVIEERTAEIEQNIENLFIQYKNEVQQLILAEEATIEMMNEKIQKLTEQLTEIDVYTKGESDEKFVFKEVFQTFSQRTDNPHQVTKAQVGLPNVDNIKQAPKTDFDAHIANKNNPHSVKAEQLLDLLDLTYPVGAIYISVNLNNPTNLFGGVWERFAQGQTLIGVDENDTEFSNSEKIGGSKTHSHASGSLVGNLQISGTTLAYQSKPTNYTSTVRAVNFTAVANAEKMTTGTAIGGSTEDGNSMQPYVVIYMWKRIS